MAKKKKRMRRSGRKLEYKCPPVPTKRRDRKRQLLARKVHQADLGRNTKVADLVEQMGGMSIQARNIGRCAEVLKRLYKDKARPTVFLGLAGPLIAAGLRKVILDLVVGGYVDVIVSTGAILYQDIYQARGFQHYRGTPTADDVELHELRIDRIYDTYVDEEKFWETDTWCGRVADELEPGNYSSRAYLDHVGSKLTDPNSIVHQCHKLGVPMFCPAINDSSIGIGLTEHYHRHRTDGTGRIAIDSLRDNYELVQTVLKSKKTAAIYVAGGVPKNYINDSIVMAYIFNQERGHDYAIQVTTAVTQDGGLSSSTLGEAQSWGKVDAKAKFAMAWVEPSVSLPLLAAYAFNRFPAPARARLRFQWEEDRLVSLKRSS
ncbi:MAG: deoxyhypusine synthase family protein [Planctomycetota bacterium]|jgi:deoxyhypusine synthase